MAEDAEQIARIRSKLYDFVANNPEHPDAEQARRILGKLPHAAMTDVGEGARRASAGMPAEHAEADTGEGPEYVEDKNHIRVGGKVRERTPYEKSSIDPTAQFLAENLVLHGAGKALGSAAKAAVAGTKGAKAAEVISEANGPLDPAAEKAAEALRFKLFPSPQHMATSALAGGVGQHFGHGGLGLLADFLVRNLTPIEGAISRGVASRFMPPLLMGAGTAAGGE